MKRTINIKNASVETRKRGNGFTVVIIFSNKTLEHVHSAKEHKCLTEEAACALANKVFAFGKVNPELWVTVQHELALKPKKFTAKRTKTWQYDYKLLFSKERGTVNIQFGLSQRKVPFGTDAPKDGDLIFDNYGLCWKKFGIDVFRKDELELISPAIGNESRTLMDCWRIALADYYMEHDAHWPELHPSWYEWVETY
jgi:hypothetical protein